MTSIGKSFETHFFFELRTQVKVKALDYHPTKPLLAYANRSNIFALWDWEKKTCLKCFNAAAFESKDLTKNVTPKLIKFLDKDILSSLFPHETFDTEANFYSGSWLIIISELKVYLYDYVSEKIEVIPASALDNKLPKCVEIVGSRTLAIGCSEGVVKIFDFLSWSTVKTLKGIHHKNINALYAYRLDDAKNRLAVSSHDGVLACWNLDNEEVFFKFGMMKSGKQIMTANNQEDLTSISFNRASNHIVTVSQSYITVWSAKTGDEIMRYKNIKDSNKEYLTEAHFLNYGNLGVDTMVGHGKSTEVLLFDVGKGGKDGQLDTYSLLDYKLLQDFDKNVRIYLLKVHCDKPHLIFVGTNQGAYVLSLTKTNVHLGFVTSPFYTSYFTPQQIKEFTNEDGTIKNLGKDSIQKCQSYELVDIGNRLPNILALSVSNSIISCFVLNRSKLDDLPNGGASAVMRTIIGGFDNASVEEEFDLKSSLDGKFFSIRYLKSGVFSIYAVTNRNLRQQRESDNLLEIENLHPIGLVEKIHSGCASSLEWHQEKNEFIALVPLDKSGKYIEVKEKVETVSKGGFFGSKVSKKTFQVNSAEIAKYVLFIFEARLEGSSPKVQIKHKNDTFNAPKKVFGGPFYGVVDTMTEPDFAELIDQNLEPIKRELRSAISAKLRFYDFNEGSGELTRIGKPLLVPEQLYWNLSCSILVVSYRASFFIFKYNEMKKEFKFYQVVSRKITSGFFWENIFFYVSDDSIRMAIFDLPAGLLDIVLAVDNPDTNLLGELFFEEYFTKNNEFIYDTIHPHPQMMPPGHLKILGVYDYKLLLAGSGESFYRIELDHPFIRICLLLQFQNCGECLFEVKRLDQKTWENVFDLFEAYNCQSESNTLLTLMKDVEMKNRCVLKRSFLSNDNEALNYAENSPFLALRLKESLGLEYLAHFKSYPKFDLTQTPDSVNSSVMTSLCSEQTSEHFLTENPGLYFAGNFKNNLEQTHLKEYFEKLLLLAD